MGLSEACRLLEELLSRLSSKEARLLVEALEEACKTGDPAAFYHRASMIEPWIYYSRPSPPFPGFFKKLECREAIQLPEPRLESGIDTLTAIARRRSRRRYSSKPLDLETLSTLLYAAVGITGSEAGWPLRSYPSAGGLQPVEAYLSASRVEGLEPGIYHYNPLRNELCLLREGDYSETLADICLGQEHVADAPASLIFTVVYQRSASKYATRAYRYVHLDAGAVMENVYIAAEALGLATVAVGAFYDKRLCELLDVDCYWEFPVLVMPVGWRIE